MQPHEYPKHICALLGIGARNLLCVHRLLNTPLGVKQGLCGIIRYVSHVLMERLDSHIPRIARGSGRKPFGRIPQLTSGDGFSSEDGYVGQLPGHVAAPLVHGGLNPIVGGASADTRLAVLTSAVANH